MATIFISPGGDSMVIYFTKFDYQGQIIFNLLTLMQSLNEKTHAMRLLQDRCIEEMRVGRLEAFSAHQKRLQIQEETRKHRREHKVRLRQLEVEGQERLRHLQLETRRLEASIEALKTGAESRGSNNVPPSR